MVGTFLGVTAAEAKHFILPVSPPQSYRDVLNVVMKSIPEDLAQAQCGGWSRSIDDPALGSVADKIAQVSGVPGRQGQPLGNLLSGMAKRIETGGSNENPGYTYPASARGVTTACPKGATKITVPILTDCRAGNLAFREITLPFPITDPLCHDPKECGDMCDAMNTGDWLYEHIQTCGLFAAKSVRFVCTQEETWTGWANCLPCKGEFCRCEEHPWCRFSPKLHQPYQSFFRRYDVVVKREKVPDVPRDNAGTPLESVVDPNGNPVIGPDGKPLMRDVPVPVGCYGFYHEFDPKTKAVEGPDRRCVIDIDVADRKGPAGSQQDHGQYGDPSRADDPAPLVRKNFKPDEDLWYQNLGGAISFFNDNVFKEHYGRDLSTALLNADEAKMEAIHQVSRMDPKKLAASSVLRTFDDSVSNERGDRRTVTEWWQRFETDAHRLFTPPVVRLLLPASWALGIDPSDPLFVGSLPSPAAPSPGPSPAVYPEPSRRAAGEGSRDPRMKSIEIQLDAKEDLLGQIAAYIDRQILLNVQEEPIPIVVPLASPVELRSVAESWEAWKRTYYPAGGAPAEVDDLITKLTKEYPAQIEKVRLLRAELPRYIGKLLEHQKNVYFTTGRWMEENLQRYRDFLKARTKRLALQQDWKGVQQLWDDFNDSVNFPWCKDDRFTTPIYSLLDPWLPGRPGLEGGDTENCSPGSGGLPRLCIGTDDRDIIFDFSTLQVPKETLKLPVLEPIQVRLRLPVPPAGTGAIKDAHALVLPDLPDFQSMGSIAIAIQNRFPTVTVASTPGVIEPPPVMTDEQLTTAASALSLARTILQGMIDRYREFWDNLQPHPDLACPGFASPPCVYTEMDLIEQFTRVWARPAVLLREDFDSVGTPRKPLNDLVPNPPSVVPKAVPSKDRYDCNSADHVCLPVLGEKRPKKDGWQIVLPHQNESEGAVFLRDLRGAVRNQTLDPDGKIQGGVPYISAPVDIYPSFDVPSSIDLRPLPPTSSSSP